MSRLQAAIDDIFAQIGCITDISPVYQSSSWGFDAPDFYNACIGITTFYSTQKVLEILLSIEENNGRMRSKDIGYQSRSLDLDILFSSEGKIATSSLTVPHPLLQERKFVLQPLYDIVPELIHFGFQKTIRELLIASNDNSSILPLKKRLRHPRERYPIEKLQYLVIEGNIGAGKTTLANLIATEFNAKLIVERFAENPFLPLFYKDMDRYALSLEMSFLTDRYQHLQDDIRQFDLFKSFVVSDYSIYKCLIFAEVTLSVEEFRVFKRVFNIISANSLKPGMYAFLYQNTEQLVSNIKKRGRAYEQDIEVSYLNNIHKGYLQFMNNNTLFPVLKIDVSGMDFIKNRKDYITILDQICQS